MAAEALEALAGELAARGWIVRLHATGRLPRLYVRNPAPGAGGLSEYIYAGPTRSDGSWAYWWPWADKIGPVTDIRQAAEKITRVLAVAAP